MKWLKNSINLMLLSFASTTLAAQPMISNDVLTRVFLIGFGGQQASCILVSIDSQDYLITAKHLFPDSIPFNSSVHFSIFRSNTWVENVGNLLYHLNSDIDIAVLRLNTNAWKQNNFDIGSKNFFLTQECFFLGFPFGLMMPDSKGDINGGYPLPFVKKGIVSAFSVRDPVQIIYLDGYNNPGFSGGPVIVPNLSGTEHKLSLIGVVSGYRFDEKKVGGNSFKENTGIVITYGIDHVFEIIKRKQ